MGEERLEVDGEYLYSESDIYSDSNIPQLMNLPSIPSQGFVERKIRDRKLHTRNEKEIFDKLTATNVPSSPKQSGSNRNLFTSEHDLFSDSSQPSNKSGQDIDTRILKVKQSLDNAEIGKTTGSSIFETNVRDDSSDVASAGDVFNIKDCLREHYSAIKELQNSILNSKAGHISTDNVNITERIRSIEQTLKQLSGSRHTDPEIAEQYNKLSTCILENKDAIEELKARQSQLIDHNDFSVQSLQQLEITRTVNRQSLLEEEMCSLKSLVQTLQEEIKSFKRLKDTMDQPSRISLKEVKENEKRITKENNAVDRNLTSVQSNNLSQDIINIPPNANDIAKEELRTRLETYQKEKTIEQGVLKEEIESLKSQLHKSQYDLKLILQENESIQKKYSILEKTVFKLNDELKQVARGVKPPPKPEVEEGKVKKENLKKEAPDPISNEVFKEESKSRENSRVSDLFKAKEHSKPIDQIKAREETNSLLRKQIEKLQNEINTINTVLGLKVDTVVLQELARHIATRQDLKKFIRKSQMERIINLEINNLKDDFTKQQLELEKTILKKFSLSKVNFNIPDSLHSDLQSNLLAFKSIAEEQLKSMAKRIDNLEDSKTELKQIENDSSIKDLAREFDEKLYTLCSELSNCKSLFAMQANQPFYRCAQWIWNSGKLKLGSAIPWNLETTNTDPDNFKWEQDHYNIRIVDAGLYEINFAFFTKAKPSIQVETILR
ncbi:hypothetical protein HK103_005194 [Boothiomyces macroporosus]|uniref:Uncharacterized protein n=1 Tax=Boothiomyces macroporosus TaxID=261099 RepID=A0AAD5Y3G6_9FUNG|nr:hypothetical protein HK103_005194 [Boothiomyces macroporosus]